MSRYAILKNGLVVNVTISGSADDGWILLDDDSPVSIGWSYDGESFSQPLVYTLGNESVTANGAAAQSFAGNYYAQKDSALVLSGEITDSNGDLVTSITFPMAVKLPMIRHADGTPTTDEIYLDVTIVNGVITATGDADRSGDWKLVIARVNEAVKRVGMPWSIAASDITILV